MKIKILKDLQDLNKGDVCRIIKSEGQDYVGDLKYFAENLNGYKEWVEEKDFEIIEPDLRDILISGRIVEYNSGDKYIILNNNIIFVKNATNIKLIDSTDDFDHDLKHREKSGVEIINIFEAKCSLSDSSSKDLLQKVWSREDTLEMGIVEPLKTGNLNINGRHGFFASANNGKCYLVDGVGQEVCEDIDKENVVVDDDGYLYVRVKDEKEFLNDSNVKIGLGGDYVHDATRVSFVDDMKDNFGKLIRVDKVTQIDKIVGKDGYIYTPFMIRNFPINLIKYIKDNNKGDNPKLNKKEIKEFGIKNINDGYVEDFKENGGVYYLKFKTYDRLVEFAKENGLDEDEIGKNWIDLKCILGEEYVNGNMIRDFCGKYIRVDEAGAGMFHSNGWLISPGMIENFPYDLIKKLKSEKYILNPDIRKNTVPFADNFDNIVKENQRMNKDVSLSEEGESLKNYDYSIGDMVEVIARDDFYVKRGAKGVVTCIDYDDCTVLVKFKSGEPVADNESDVEWWVKFDRVKTIMKSF